jgi:hypothetical protein
MKLYFALFAFLAPFAVENLPQRAQRAQRKKDHFVPVYGITSMSVANIVGV